MAVFVCPGIITTPSFPETFADATWEQIIDACHQNAVPDTWVADGTCYKDMEINGTNYRIDVIGKNHDTYTDGGTAPLTFQMHDCYETTYQMNSSNTNSGGWNSCAMRSTHLPAILALMPAEVQAAIKEVQKKTSAGNKSSSIQTTNDKLFLLSEIEVFGSIALSFSGEGKQYDYYKEGNSKIKYYSGAGAAWWERSPYSRGSGAFCFVNQNGGAGGAGANAKNTISFAFCF